MRDDGQVSIIRTKVRIVNDFLLSTEMGKKCEAHSVETIFENTEPMYSSFYRNLKRINDILGQFNIVYL
jgi:hypothetical protein